MVEVAIADVPLCKLNGSVSVHFGSVRDRRAALTWDVGTYSCVGRGVDEHPEYKGASRAVRNRSKGASNFALAVERGRRLSESRLYTD